MAHPRKTERRVRPATGLLPAGATCTRDGLWTAIHFSEARLAKATNAGVVKHYGDGVEPLYKSDEINDWIWNYEKPRERVCAATAKK